MISDIILIVGYHSTVMINPTE